MTEVYFILFALILTGLELFYFRMAASFRILDHPNQRSLHENPTIRGGGVIFYFAALLFFVVTFRPSLLFIIALSMVSVVGFMDDLVSLSSLLRFILQCAAFLLIFFGSDWNGMGLIAITVMFIVSVGALNAFNFMDGINGLTGGYGLIALASLLYIDMAFVNFIGPDFIFAIGIAVLIFCYFNFRKKAVCFAGDVGSLSIGFIILFLIIRIILMTGNFSYVFLLSVYGIDSISTIVHRLALRQNIFKAHKLHLFQVIINNSRITHLQMTGIYMLVQGIINIIVIRCLSLPLSTQYVVGGLMELLLVASYVGLKYRLMKSSIAQTL